MKLIAAHEEITVLPSMDCADAQSPLIPLFVFYASMVAAYEGWLHYMS